MQDASVNAHAVVDERIGIHCNDSGFPDGNGIVVSGVWHQRMVPIMGYPVLRTGLLNCLLRPIGRLNEIVHSHDLIEVR